MGDPNLSSIIDQALSSKSELRYWANLLGISTLMGGCASILSEDMRSFKGFIRCTVLALGSSYLVGSMLQNSGMYDGYIHCIIGLSALYANYIFIFISKVIKGIAGDPRAFIDNILDRIIGGKK